MSNPAKAATMAMAETQRQAATPQEHYERLLAQHYTWMFGRPFEQIVEEQKSILRAAGVRAPGMALDLGCGPGFQAIALSQLGASRVHAFDTNAALLQELEARTGGHDITTHKADLRAFDQIVEAAADTIVCMGDTLTHLATKPEVAMLFGKIATSLQKGGRLVLSWRDLSQPPVGLERFIAIRSTDDANMTCFLEDRGEYVLVHDLIHVRGGQGWQFHKSAYPKLKLAPAWIGEALSRAGLRVDHEQSIKGMSVLGATRQGHPV